MHHTAKQPSQSEDRKIVRPRMTEDSYFSSREELQRSDNARERGLGSSAGQSASSGYAVSTPDTVVDEDSIDELRLPALERQCGSEFRADVSTQQAHDVEEMFDEPRPRGNQSMSIKLPPPRAQIRNPTAHLDSTGQQLSREDYKHLIASQALFDFRAKGTCWHGPHPPSDTERLVFQRQVNIFLDIIEGKNAEIARLREQEKSKATEGRDVKVMRLREKSEIERLLERNRELERQGVMTWETSEIWMRGFVVGVLFGILCLAVLRK